MDETAVQRVSGLETWFALPGRTAPAPPRWKMAVVTVLAIVPLVLAMNVLVLPQLTGWPVVARTLVFSGTLTTLMTWVVMPRMTRLFRRFLYGPRR
jgi:antibiotic biosynthesis monooxygenase (ABM) superfamily enzyme